MSTSIHTIEARLSVHSKAWYQSKKLWAAGVTGVANVGAVAATIYVGHPELATVLATSITAIGAALVIAIGQADKGKEAALIAAVVPAAEPDEATP
jgi:hypothetical protein